MASGGHGGLSFQRPKHAEPQPAPISAPPEPIPSKRDLTSWWRNFSKKNVKKEEPKEILEGIFGVPLQQSIRYANVAISLFDNEGHSYIYGYVPIVVAKCGVFLKEKATDVEGIFRLSGSEKRIKELKVLFDSPDRYGKGLDWTGYTVHDAANILRRYFNQLPEPIIPLDFYDKFRQPLRGHQEQAVGPMDGQAKSEGEFDMDATIRTYQTLITELPPLNRQLLLYILDLLAVFASKSDLNKMTTPNLSAIFQPGILSHPAHDMAPPEYRLSQDVLIFLIENQDHFLIGMQGTAADEQTVKEVQSGPPTPSTRTPTTPGRNQTAIGRSTSSSSSAGADSVRKYGFPRRNVSVSSRQSKKSIAAPSPAGSAFGTPINTAGVHRSNTVPSQKSPAIGPARLGREKVSDPSTPTSGFPGQTPTGAAAPPAPEALTPSTPRASSLAETAPVTPAQKIASVVQAPLALAPAPVTVPLPTPDISNTPGAFPGELPPQTAPDQNANSVESAPVPRPSVVSSSPVKFAEPGTEAQAQPAPQMTNQTPKADVSFAPSEKTPQSAQPPPRTFTSIFAKTPPQDQEKKESAFGAIFGRPAAPHEWEKRDSPKPKKLQKRRNPSANPSAHSSTHSLTGPPPPSFDGPPSPLPPGMSTSSGTPIGTSTQQSQLSVTDSTPSKQGVSLKPSMSPTASFRSHSTVTDYSEEAGDETPVQEEADKEKKRRWRLSSKRDSEKPTPTQSEVNLGANAANANATQQSLGSISSGSGGRSRRSFQEQKSWVLEPKDQQGPQHTDAGNGSQVSVSASESEKKGPVNWFRGKLAGRKEREEAKKRMKSPPPNANNRNDLSVPGMNASGEALPVRGKSMEVPRTITQSSSDVTPTQTPSANPEAPVAQVTPPAVTATPPGGKPAS